MLAAEMMLMEAHVAGLVTRDGDDEEDGVFLRRRDEGGGDEGWGGHDTAAAKVAKTVTAMVMGRETCAVDGMWVELGEG